jgi:hypothetical protein
MRVRAVPFVASALLALAAVPVMPAPARSADDKTKTPTIIVRLASLDTLISDARYLASQAGQAEGAKQGEAWLKSLMGDKGLEGFDSKRPVGFYGYLGPNGVDSSVVLMLPVADEKAVLDLLKRLKIKPEKDKDGIYSFTPEKSPFPAYFRFANKYVYATIREKEILEDGQLLAPRAVLPAEEVGTLSASFNFGGVPKEIREVILGQAELRLNDLKDQKKEGETAGQKELRVKVLDELALTLKSLLNDSGTLSVAFNIDPKADDLSATLSLSARAGSPLAKKFQSLAETKSAVAGLIAADSAASSRLTIVLPDEVRKVLGPAVDDAVAQGIKNIKDRGAREFWGRYAKALVPTLKQGVLDVAGDFRGPTQAKQYAIVTAVRVKDGAGLEKALRELVEKIPEEAKGKITLDADKAGAVNIHRLNVEADLDAGARATLGKNPAFVAVREDAVFFAVGDGGLKAIKEAVAARPKSGPVMHLEMAMKHVASLMARDRKEAPEAAREAFKGKNKDLDKVYLTLEGGQALRLRAGIKGPVLRFFSLMEEAKQKSGE